MVNVCIISPSHLACTRNRVYTEHSNKYNYDGLHVGP
jgi:hypothetical protein